MLRCYANYARFPGRFLGLLLALWGALDGLNAQTVPANVAGFTGTLAAMQSAPGTAVFDLNANTDLTKQAAGLLAGTGQDIVGAANAGSIFFATGTYTGGAYTNAAAIEVAIRLGNSATSAVVKNSGYAVLFDNDVSNWTDASKSAGIAVSFGANFGTATVYLISPNAGTTLDAAFSFTPTTLASGLNLVAFTPVTTTSYGATSTDAFLTFMALTSDFSSTAVGVLSNVTGVSAFSDSGGSAIANGKINDDFLGDTNVATAHLAFGSQSGTGLGITPVVPEAPTGLLAGVIIVAGAGAARWRRRRKLLTATLSVCR